LHKIGLSCNVLNGTGLLLIHRMEQVLCMDEPYDFLTASFSDRKTGVTLIQNNPVDLLCGGL
jgi:hypothetical protein